MEIDIYSVLAETAFNEGVANIVSSVLTETVIGESSAANHQVSGVLTETVWAASTHRMVNAILVETVFADYSLSQSDGSLVAIGGIKALNFPTLSVGIDQSSWNEAPEDPGMQTQMDGGYVVSRARYMRAPRHTWKFNLTNISWTDRNLLDNFWANVQGTSGPFWFPHPFDGRTYLVRFAKPINFKYRAFTYLADGVTKDHRFDVSGIELQEV